MLIRSSRKTGSTSGSVESLSNTHYCCVEDSKPCDEVKSRVKRFLNGFIHGKHGIDADHNQPDKTHDSEVPSVKRKGISQQFAEV